MKLGLCAQVLYHMPLREGLSLAALLGFEAIELPVDARSPFLDLDAALSGGWRDLKRLIADSGLTISALSNHQEGQLLLGPHGHDTDTIHRGDAAEKARYATERLLATAALAEALEVPTVVGFTGCEDYARWFPWPDPGGYEGMGPIFVERMTPTLWHGRQRQLDVRGVVETSELAGRRVGRMRTQVAEVGEPTALLMIQPFEEASREEPAQRVLGRTIRLTA